MENTKENAIDFIFKNHPDPDLLFIGDKKHDSNTIKNVSSLMVQYSNDQTTQLREDNERLKQQNLILQSTLKAVEEQTKGVWKQLRRYAKEK